MTVPLEYFNDEVTMGVSRGTLRHLKYSRFCIVRLPVGYGKTLVAVLTAVGIAKQHNNVVQIGVIAPKAKRLDKSFTDALASASEYFGVTFKTLLINNEEVGTFAGLSRELGGTNGIDKDELASMPAEKIRNLRRKAIRNKAKAIAQEPTVFILDETHMTLRDSTTVTSKSFTAMLNQVDRAGGFVKVIGLTATPFDKSILDTIGYLVFNGNYNSRENFYTREVIDYKQMKRDKTQDEIESMLVNYKFKINYNRFVDPQRIIDQARRIIYNPRAPKNFHIPENKIHLVKVPLDETAKAELKKLRKLEKADLFASATEKRNAFITTMTVNDAMQAMVRRIIKSDQFKQPLFFYQFNTQRDALTEIMQAEGVPYAEVNGLSHSYFNEETDETMPVIVQYGSGATAFEAKTSNTSIYYGLPDSSINFDQSLGRNARRGQAMDVIHNYILEPIDASGKPVAQFKRQYQRIVDKVTQNGVFLKLFETQWGQFENAPKRLQKQSK